MADKRNLLNTSQTYGTLFYNQSSSYKYILKNISEWQLMFQQTAWAMGPANTIREFQLTFLVRSINLSEKLKGTLHIKPNGNVLGLDNIIKLCTSLGLGPIYINKLHICYTRTVQ